MMSENEDKLLNMIASIAWCALGGNAREFNSFLKEFNVEHDEETNKYHFKK